jgi:hypothetical protein
MIRYDTEHDARWTVQYDDLRCLSKLRETTILVPATLPISNCRPDRGRRRLP